MNRDPFLCNQFIKTTKEILTTYPEIKHEWSIDEDEDHCILDIPKQKNNGFDITIEVSAKEIAITAASAHTHFDLEKSYEKTIQSSLSLVRDLLSPGMRIRELVSSGHPYKWYIEALHDEKWVIEEENGLLFWNYFGKRTEKIYQDEVLKMRYNNT